MINDDTPLYGTRYRLKLMVGVFKCRTCGHEQSIEQTGELMVAPTSCPNGCDCTKKGFILDPDKSTFEETPYTVKTSLRELKEKVKDWDRLSGISSTNFIKRLFVGSAAADDEGITV